MKWSKKHLILSLLLPVQILLVQLAAKYPAFIEHYYANGIYLLISKGLRFFLGWIPFSVGDFLLAVLLFLFLRFLYRLVTTRFQNLVPKMLQLTATLSIIYFCFYLFWGLNYYREPLAKNLGLENSKYTTHQLQNLSIQLIKKLNQTHLSISKSDTIKIAVPYNSKEIYKKALNGYDHLSKQYPQLAYTLPSVKSSLMSLLQTYNGTGGYLNPLTGEAQVNDRIPKTTYPATTCHEMAHQLGIAAENEANFVGFLASISNDDLYFQYSGYRMATRYVLYELYRRDRELYKEIYKTINLGIRKDFKASTEFWNRYKNPLEPLVKKGYNAYLKANKQTKGVQSYNYVVDLLISYYKVQSTK